MYTSQLATSICYSFFFQYQVEIPLLFRHYFDMYAVPTFITVTVFVISKIITGGEFFYLFQFVQSFLSSIIITARILQFTNGRMWWWWWYYRLSLIFTQDLPNTLLTWNQPFFENHSMFLWVKNGEEIESKRI